MNLFRISVAAGIVLLLPARASAEAPACTPGQAITEDTAGHCCWLGQAWSRTKQACIGIPQACPAGLTPQAETCAAPACPAGEQVSSDTAGHCCWPGQAWSGDRSTCVGIPQCPSKLVAVGEMCAVQVPSAAAPKHPPTDPTAHVIRFGAKLPEVDHYRVSVDEQSCSTPCTMTLPAGTVKLRVEGDAHYSRDIDIPNHSAIVRVTHLRVGGIVLGATFISLGVPLAFAGFTQVARGNELSGGAQLGFGVMGTVGGALVIMGPVFLSAIGANRPVVESADFARRAGVRVTTVGLVPTRGGMAGGFGLAF